MRRAVGPHLQHDQAASGSRTSGGPAPTGGSEQTNGAVARGASVVATVVGVVFSVAFFA